MGAVWAVLAYQKQAKLRNAPCTKSQATLPHTGPSLAAALLLALHLLAGVKALRVNEAMYSR